MDEFEKLAQRRSVWNKVRPSNVTRQVAKLSPGYREQYSRLTNADDYIRNIRTSDGESIKDLLKELKKNVKNYRWIAVLDTAAKINEIAKLICDNKDIKDLLKNMKSTLQDFYFTTEDSKGRSVDLSRIESIVNSAVDDVDFVKQAIWGNIGRGLTNKFLESFQDKDAKKVRIAINSIANRAQTLANRIIYTYDILDIARAKGSISSYIDAITALKKEQESFESMYKDTYSAISPFLPKQDAVLDSYGNGANSTAEKEPTPKQKHSPSFQFGPEGLGQNINVEDIPDSAIEIQPAETRNIPPELPPERRNLADWAKEIQKNYEEEEKQRIMDENQKFLDDVKTKGLTVDAARKAILERKYGMAAALLSQYSQELEDAGNMVESAKILALAEDIFNAK